MPYRSTKTYGHDLGISVSFRQWRADSHCKLIHGYALSFHFVFEADELDHRNWVVDFGGLKQLKGLIQQHFDHKLIVAKDDPLRAYLHQLEALGAAEIVLLERVGCEAFARYGYALAVKVLEGVRPDGAVRVVSCEVREHGANSAIYIGDK